VHFAGRTSQRQTLEQISLITWGKKEKQLTTVPVPTGREDEGHEEKKGLRIEEDKSEGESATPTSRDLRQISRIAQII
jgi:hypothetical protein